MATTPVTSAPAGNTPAGTSASASTTSAAAANSAMLNQNQFLQLLTAQLQNQDPLNPVQESDFTSQLAQFSTLSSVQQLNTSIQQMVQLQQVTQGAALVGKVVRYADASNNPASGTVDAVNFQGGQMTLQVGGKTVASDQIRGIAS